MYRVGIGIVFTVCIIKCTVASTFSLFGEHGPRLTQTSLGGPQKNVLTKFYCSYKGQMWPKSNCFKGLP